jgi:hypothetical protein
LEAADHAGTAGRPLPLEGRVGRTGRGLALSVDELWGPPLEAHHSTGANTTGRNIDATTGSRKSVDVRNISIAVLNYCVPGTLPVIARTTKPSELRASVLDQAACKLLTML